MLSDLILTLPTLLAVTSVTTWLVKRRKLAAYKLPLFLFVHPLAPAGLAFGLLIFLAISPEAFGSLLYPGYCVSWPEGNTFSCTVEEWLYSGQYRWARLIYLLQGGGLLAVGPLAYLTLRRYWLKD